MQFYTILAAAVALAASSQAGAIPQHPGFKNTTVGGPQAGAIPQHPGSKNNTIGGPRARAVPQHPGFKNTTVSSAPSSNATCAGQVECVGGMQFCTTDRDGYKVLQLLGEPCGNKTVGNHDGVRRR